ncbi:MAG: cation:proton antiporter [Armatimonadota bacterium]|nr:cation:proton antiporter [Armatimonadota bacterium]MDR7485969.1 cation:proton antiporter [Armatimonadota bacterium]MDR7537311.1 cation:proton antiporter [Armatimonadota bacterium]
MAHGRVFLDLGLVLVAALAGGLLAHALRQPLIVGYVLAGIAVGPFTPGPTVADPRSFELFAEIGVVLLMFSIGIEFSLDELLRVRRAALVGGPLGIATILLLTLPVGRALGWPVVQTAVVGAALSVASTMVVLKFLLERGELHAPHGQVTLGVTLFEDLAVVAMTVLLPALGPTVAHRPAALLRGLLVAALILVPTLWMARRVVPPLWTRIARAQSEELFLLVAIAVAIGTAALTAGLGLSLALGAFLAGLVISESEFAHEALARILPIRDVFVAVFFVSLGMLMRPAVVLAQWATVLALVSVIVAGKCVVWTGVLRLLGLRLRTAALVGLALTQIGEFSYILAAVGRAEGILSGQVYDAILAASLVSILVNAAIFRRTPGWIERLLARLEPAGPVRDAAPPPPGHVLVCGFGRIGRAVVDALEAFGIPYAVVDLDPDATGAARRRGAHAVYGNAADELILDRAGAASARLAVVAVPDAEVAARATRTLRRLRPDLPILVRAHHEHHRDRLVAAGAAEVVQPEIEAALTIVRHSLDHLGIDHHRGREYLARVRAGAPSTGQRGASSGADEERRRG